MKYKLITALLLFSTCNFADSINTGHANVSLIKYSANNSEANEFYIGVKMDMQKKLAYLLEKPRGLWWSH